MNKVKINSKAEVVSELIEDKSLSIEKQSKKEQSERFHCNTNHDMTKNTEDKRDIPDEPDKQELRNALNRNIKNQEQITGATKKTRKTHLN